MWPTFSHLLSFWDSPSVGFSFICSADIFGCPKVAGDTTTLSNHVWTIKMYLVCKIYYSCPLLSLLRNQLQIRKGKPIDKFPIYLSVHVFQPSTKRYKKISKKLHSFLSGNVFHQSTTTLQKRYQKITFIFIWKCLQQSTTTWQKWGVRKWLTYIIWKRFQPNIFKHMNLESELKRFQILSDLKALNSARSFSEIAFESYFSKDKTIDFATIHVCTVK